MLSSVLSLFFAVLVCLSSTVLGAIPQTFQHTNLLRTVDLTKSYVHDSTALILENIGNSPQTEYFWGIPIDLDSNLSYLEIKEKKSGSTQLFPVEKSTEDHPFLQIYKVQIPELKAGEKISLVISAAYVDSLTPYPAIVPQEGNQYLLYKGEKYAPTLYPTLKQKTKIKFPGTIESYTEGKKNIDGDPDPTKSGSTLTYGPYGRQDPTTSLEKITVHYEFTHDIAYVEHLQRDVEVSHWGNNLAIEEHYKLTNHAAKLKEHFSRLHYTRSNYHNPPTHAITRLTFPLKNGARDAYYVDTIGNVSTSRFRPARGANDANLEISPRYPVYGGWNYTFRIGWNVDLEKVIRVKGTERVLKIPFVEGPENIQYETFVVNIILPEGSRDVRVFTPQSPLSEERYLHRTFLDTLGRTGIRLTFANVVDDRRGKEIVVIYEYPRFAGVRKVVVVALGVLGLFVTRLVGGWIFEGGIGGK